MFSYCNDRQLGAACYANRGLLSLHTIIDLATVERGGVRDPLE